MKGTQWGMMMDMKLRNKNKRVKNKNTREVKNSFLMDVFFWDLQQCTERSLI